MPAKAVCVLAGGILDDSFDKVVITNKIFFRFSDVKGTIFFEQEVSIFIDSLIYVQTE